MMARKLCTDCGFRKISTRVSGPELCDVCLDWADIEVYHFDYDLDEAHELAGVTGDNCPVCHPEHDKRHVKRTGHTNTVAKSRTSHADHYHPRTPEHRAACRKLTRAGKAPLDLRKTK